MAQTSPIVSHESAIRLLQRVGLSSEAAAEIVAHLPDPFDLDLARPVFARYGLTTASLTNRLGGSP
jgi:hypothetical protein